MFSGKAGTEWRQLFVALITCGLLALNSALALGYLQRPGCGSGFTLREINDWF